MYRSSADGGDRPIAIALRGALASIMPHDGGDGEDDDYLSWCEYSSNRRRIKYFPGKGVRLELPFPFFFKKF